MAFLISSVTWYGAVSGSVWLSLALVLAVLGCVAVGVGRLPLVLYSSYSLEILVE